MTPFGKYVGVELLDLFVNALQHGIGIVSFLQEDNAFDSVRIVDDCAVGKMGGSADLAEPNLRTLRDGGNVFDLNGARRWRS